MWAVAAVKHRVAILMSGRGSNMTALIKAACDPLYPAQIVSVISNRIDAPGLETARACGIVHRLNDRNHRCTACVAPPLDPRGILDGQVITAELRQIVGYVVK